MLELWAYQNLYLRGGAFPTADNNVTLRPARAWAAAPRSTG